MTNVVCLGVQCKDETTHIYCIDHDTLISGLTLLYGQKESWEFCS